MKLPKLVSPLPVKQKQGSTLYLGVYHLVLAVILSSWIYGGAIIDGRPTLANSSSTYYALRIGLFIGLLGIVLTAFRKWGDTTRWVVGIAIISRVILVALLIAAVATEPKYDSSWPIAGELLAPAILECAVAVTWLFHTLRREDGRHGFGLGNLGMAVLSTILTVLLALFFTVFSVSILGEYGTALFALTPLFLGAFSAYLCGYAKPASFGECMGAAGGAILLVMLGLLFTALEGAMCIAMAFPLIAVMTFLGACVGYGLQQLRWGKPYFAFCLVLLNPLSMLGEKSLDRVPPLVTVVTERKIPVEAAAVWRILTEPTALNLSQTFLGKLGVTVPERIRLVRSPSGHVLECEMTNDTVVLEVSELVEYRKLAFRPRHEVVPMKELTPYDHIHAPHLEGYLVVEYGSIELVPESGGTLIRAETRLRHRIWPASYWRIYTEKILDVMHEEVIAALERAAGQVKKREG